MEFDLTFQDCYNLAILEILQSWNNFILFLVFLQDCYKFTILQSCFISRLTKKVNLAILQSCFISRLSCNLAILQSCFGGRISRLQQSCKLDNLAILKKKNNKRKITKINTTKQSTSDACALVCYPPTWFVTHPLGNKYNPTWFVTHYHLTILQSYQNHKFQPHRAILTSYHLTKMKRETHTILPSYHHTRRERAPCHLTILPSDGPAVASHGLASEHWAPIC